MLNTDECSSESPDLRDRPAFREFKKLVLRLLSASPEPLSYHGIRQKLIGAGCEADSYRIHLALEDLESDGKVLVDRSCVNITRFHIGGGLKKPMHGPGEWTGRVCRDRTK